MSKEIKNPNAFPTMEHGYNMQGISTVFTYEGMTLRDYFAAKAMQALVSRANHSDGFSQDEAGQAYWIADAMLKERQK